MSRSKGPAGAKIRLIPNADDLGRDEGTNAVVFDLMSNGRLTSATLLANGSKFPEAASRARDFPRCSFGVHLNLTEGFPLTGHPGLKSILNPDGAFRNGKIRDLLVDDSVRRAVLEEWTAQVGRVVGSGVPASHLDGHHHIHTSPGLFTTLKRVQRRFGIRRVRVTRNIHPPDALPPWSLRVSKALWNLALRRYYPTRTTEGCTSLEVFAATAAASAPPFRTVELMVHPGHPRYEEETRLLSGDWWKALPFEIQFISYLEL